MPNPGETTECFSLVSQFWAEGGFRWLPFISPAPGAAKFFIPDKLCCFNGRHLLLLQMHFDIRCLDPDLSMRDGRQSLSRLICVKTAIRCSGMVLKLCLRPFEKVVLRTLHMCTGTVCRGRRSSRGQTSKCCVLYWAPDDFWGASDDGRCCRLHRPWMC